MILRRVLAIAAGAVVFLLIIALFDAMGSALFPAAPRFDVNHPDATLNPGIPTGALAVTLGGALIAAFVAGYLATLLVDVGDAWWGLASGAIGLAATLLNVVREPHPTWFVAAAPLGVIAATTLGVWLSARRLPGKRSRQAPPHRAT